MKYGLIGEKLTHSLSPEIHRLLGNDGYCLRELKPDDLGAFMKTRDFSGINVTIPYKQAVTEYLDEIDVYAEKTRAVNTVVNRCGRLYGYNTDVYGILATLTADFCSLSGIDVFILGSGGTSRSVAYAAELLGADSIYRVSREKKGEGIVSYGQAAVMMRKKRHILINTTPVGMFPNTDGAAAEPYFGTLAGLYDAVYNPLRTDLVQKAKGKCFFSSGIRMLVTQAVYSDALFFDRTADVSSVGPIMKRITSHFANIVLVGMPSSGKSTAARIIAEKSGRKHFDTDIMISERYVASPSEIIRRYGENRFRELERGVIAEIDRSISGAVISTGGGAVVDPENVRRLRHNGFIVFLNRKSDLLVPDKDHPLTENREMLERVYRERMPVYLSCADAEVKIDEKKSPSETAEEVLDALERYDF